MVTQLIVEGNSLLIDPLDSRLIPSLSFSKRERQANSKRKYKYTKIKLYEMDDRNGSRKALTHAGLLPRTIKMMKRYGIAYNLVDNRDPICEPDTSKITDLREFQAEALAAISCAYFGVIDFPTASGKSHIITQLPAFYPDLRILVISRSASVVNSLYERLCKVTCDEGSDRKISKCTGSHTFKQISDVICITDKSLHKVPEDWPELVVYDEVHGAGSAKVAEQITRFSTARRFGLSASPKGRSDGADKLVEALFGPVIAHVTYQEAEAAGIISGICVKMISIVSDKKLDYTNDVTLERHGYWRHAQRNRVVARAAREFFSPEDQVLIFVKTAEHALCLYKRLPEFTVVHAGISKERWADFIGLGIVEEHQRQELLSVDVQGLRKQFESGELRKVICTPTWKEGVDFVHLRGLIRADGQTGGIQGTQIPGRLSRIGGVEGDGILVDFIDDFGEWYMNRSEKRMEKYESKGWKIEKLSA